MSDTTPPAPQPAPTTSGNVMEAIVSLCKRRGFVYPASEIYGGIRGFWDYGPLGVLLKNNIRDWWWRCMVECPPVLDGQPIDMVGVDTSIIQHPKTWEASGHVATFADPTITDTETKQPFRADHHFLIQTQSYSVFGDDYPSEAIQSGELPPYTIVASVLASSASEAVEQAVAMGKKLPLSSAIKLRLKAIEAGPSHDTVILVTSSGKREYASVFDYRMVEDSRPDPLDAGEWRRKDIPSPYTGTLGLLTLPRPFNLMLSTCPGPIQDEENKTYLRPETAQGIFLNFKNVLDTTRVKVPFGVAQTGKSFRNELTPRNFIFRSREFEQMEMEFFCPPADALKWYDFWRNERMKWWLSLGIAPENLKFRDHTEDELSHYSKATVDIEYKYPFTAPDFGELEGIAHRGDYDLTQHQKHSGQRLDYFDQELQLKLKADGATPEEVKAKSRYVPNVIEPASGLTRAVLVLLCEAYRNEKGRSGTEEWFAFKPQFAPIKLGIFPLVNKGGMPAVAEKLYLELRTKFTCEYDPKQSIGKRYARMDEIGTPFCVTIDGDTLKDQTVTIRERDSQKQERIPMDQVAAYVRERIEPNL